MGYPRTTIVVITSEEAEPSAKRARYGSNMITVHRKYAYVGVGVDNEAHARESPQGEVGTGELLNK